jgi:hypothetical protein
LNPAAKSGYAGVVRNLEKVGLSTLHEGPQLFL